LVADGDRGDNPPLDEGDEVEVLGVEGAAPPGGAAVFITVKIFS
jgi:hypothetical protein